MVQQILTLTISLILKVSELIDSCLLTTENNKFKLCDLEVVGGHIYWRNGQRVLGEGSS
jgi:hypothetical protein